MIITSDEIRNIPFGLSGIDSSKPHLRAFLVFLSKTHNLLEKVKVIRISDNLRENRQDGFNYATRWVVEIEEDNEKNYYLIIQGVDRYYIAKGVRKCFL